MPAPPPPTPPLAPLAPRPLTLGLIQHACPPSASRADNLARVEALIRDAAGRGARLIVTQELFSSFYFCQVEDEARFDGAEPIPGPTTRQLAGLARELGVTISASLFEKRAAGVYHNTSVLIGPSGALIGRYRKMHIPDDPRFYEKFYFTPGDLGFPVHRIPLKPEAGGPENGGTARGKTAGETRETFGGAGEISGEASGGTSGGGGGRAGENFRGNFRGNFRVGMLVCWDQWFPEAARLTALGGAEVLLYPTAIGWYHGETPADRAQQREAWQVMQRSHAIANGVFVAAVNRVGVEDDLTFWGSSFVCDPGGTVIAQASGDGDEALVVEIDLAQIECQRRGWPFLRDRRIDAYGGLRARLLDGDLAPGERDVT